MRVIVLAATKRDGAAFAKEHGHDVVAIVTPRSTDLHTVADGFVESPSLTDEMRDLLLPVVQPWIMPPRPSVNMVEATEKSILAAASYLTETDSGAIEALRALARKIDAWDQIVEWALQDAEDSSKRPAVPANDNVSISAYLKYCDQLGLSPAGRKALGVKEAGAGGKKAKLTALRSSRSA